MLLRTIASKFRASVSPFGTLAYQLSSQVYYAMNDENAEKMSGKFTRNGTALNLSLSCQKLKEAWMKHKEYNFSWTEKKQQNANLYVTYVFNTFFIYLEGGGGGVYSYLVVHLTHQLAMVQQ